MNMKKLKLEQELGREKTQTSKLQEELKLVAAKLKINSISDKKNWEHPQIGRDDEQIGRDKAIPR